MKINIPGFNAESSLNKTSGHYLAIAGTPHVFAGGREVLPQLPRQIKLLQCLGACGYNADSADYSTCTDRCFWDDFVGGGGGGGGGNGGGGGQHCRPECGPCYDDPDSPTGRSKTCIKANCDTYDKQCPGHIHESP